MHSFKPYVTTLLLAIFCFVIAASLLSFPEAAFLAALRGLKIWWDVVFPALLPFFITSEILLGLGLAHFMGVLLEPLMRPVFNIPGSGSFVWTMGFASGYPISAKLTTQLRAKNLVSRAEGERLVSYTTTADPVFITGAVAVGFFHSVKVGLVLMVVHYITAIVVGLVMSRYAPHAPRTPYTQTSNRSLLTRAFLAMHRARLEDGRTLGKLMGDAVASSLQTQLMVGGFILFFSVLLTLLMKLNLIALLSAALGGILRLFGAPAEGAQAFVYGLFEVTLGAKQASDLFASYTPAFVLASTSAILAWGGLSVHAQVASMLAQTDMRYGPFLFARALHAITAFLFTYTAGSFLYSRLQPASAVPTWATSLGLEPLSLWNQPSYYTFSLLVCAALLTLTALLWQIYHWLRMRKEPR